MTEGFDYRNMVHQASIGVVRHVLRVAAEEGLPGEHHCYLTFATGYPGVELPAVLAARHPETMTIVLQHQFWNLDIGDESFAVSLRFDGIVHRLVVPFAALTTFIDPSVPFGLDLATFGGGGGAGAEPEAEEAPPGEDALLDESDAADESAAPAAEEGDERPAEPAGTGGGEVLRFRPR